MWGRGLESERPLLCPLTYEELLFCFWRSKAHPTPNEMSHLEGPSFDDCVRVLFHGEHNALWRLDDSHLLPVWVSLEAAKARKRDLLRGQ